MISIIRQAVLLVCQLPSFFGVKKLIENPVNLFQLINSYRGPNLSLLLDFGLTFSGLYIFPVSLFSLGLVFPFQMLAGGVVVVDLLHKVLVIVDPLFLVFAFGGFLSLFDELIGTDVVQLHDLLFFFGKGGVSGVEVLVQLV